MGAWLKGLWTDEAKFIAAVRGLLASLGAAAALLPADYLAGYGRWGIALVALSQFLKAGDKNVPAVAEVQVGSDPPVTVTTETQ